MPCLSVIAFLLFISIAAPSAIAEPPSAERGVLAALDQWTSDFNAGRTDKVCDLFAAGLLADVRGGYRAGF
jgi:steroid delta-isomerase